MEKGNVYMVTKGGVERGEVSMDKDPAFESPVLSPITEPDSKLNSEYESDTQDEENEGRKGKRKREFSPTTPVVPSLSATLSAAIAVAQTVTPSEVSDESDPAFHPLSSPVHPNDSVPPPPQPHQQQQQQQQQQSAATLILTAQVGGIAALLPSAPGTSPVFFVDSSPQPYQQTGPLSPFRQLSPLPAPAFTSDFLPAPTAEPPARYLTGYPFNQLEPKYWIQGLGDFILPINVLGHCMCRTDEKLQLIIPPNWRVLAPVPPLPLAGEPLPDALEGKLFCRICTKEWKGWE
uniref:Uncharacterized protein n=1 Tax=Chromera velia CCMP2878 TaxID=1169474 RepID=A0A0G4IBH9_9ALVE|eukprot:Cvel_12767.t1-p1 / transcript=Cvel_12767.t1 / gene=Cvel_12767 / organism=Chromera_velia_CCMP2878 / gene_product=hypothetical protein / transcript_product=hypothetical protein / location=Cvel_scaffold849:35084-35953(+) / protein_length=290 / sequence_SO=supercontig / SO=protein_coding / is_pseudo=false